MQVSACGFFHPFVTNPCISCANPFKTGNPISTPARDRTASITEYAVTMTGNPQGFAMMTGTASSWNTASSSKKPAAYTAAGQTLTGSLPIRRATHPFLSFCPFFPMWSFFSAFSSLFHAGSSPGMARAGSSPMQNGAATKTKNATNSSLIIFTSHFLSA